mmetsp:Transcript_79199/g.119074  ORF Transcript_79199/g.119074 Transcript_79199/m.119074 type:complete len:195 (+) Transcript_79199:3-587(+)
MTAEGGEGVVLSIDNGAHSAAFKWKISREAQPGTISQLAALISALRPEMGEQALKASLLDPLILQLLADLYAVATHVDSKSLEEAACKEKKGRNKKEQKQEPRVLDARAVQVALASALTKFDSLDAAFQTGGRAAIPKLVERLAQEMVEDRDLEVPGEEERRALAVKEVEGDVRRFVSAAFSQWHSTNNGPRRP